jgi:hypothetical protein
VATITGAAGKLGLAYQSTRIITGFDLGQKQSHSGIIVLEKAIVKSKERDPVT